MISNLTEAQLKPVRDVIVESTMSKYISNKIDRELATARYSTGRYDSQTARALVKKLDLLSNCFYHWNVVYKDGVITP